MNSTIINGLTYFHLDLCIWKQELTGQFIAKWKGFMNLWSFRYEDEMQGKKLFKFDQTKFWKCSKETISRLIL